LPTIFNGLQSQEIKTVLARARTCDLPAKKVVYRQGDSATHFYMLKKGLLRFFTITPNGRKLVLAKILPGRTFGEAAILPDEAEEYMISVEAVRDSFAYTWDHAAIRSLSELFPTLMDNLSVAFKEYIRIAIGRQTALCAETPSERLGHFILGFTGTHGPLEIVMSDAELAHAAHLSLYTVCRVIGKWKQQGAVRRDGATLFVLSPEKLLLPIATRPQTPRSRKPGPRRSARAASN